MFPLVFCSRSVGKHFRMGTKLYKNFVIFRQDLKWKVKKENEKRSAIHFPFGFVTFLPNLRKNEKSRFYSVSTWINQANFLSSNHKPSESETFALNKLQGFVNSGLRQSCKLVFIMILRIKIRWNSFCLWINNTCTYIITS